jgi:hypothetical protein
MQHLTKTEYIKEITAMMKETDDVVMLDLICKMLRRALLHKAA